MVLNKVDDVVIELSHVVELGHEHGVAPPQPLVVLRQSRDGGACNITVVVAGGWPPAAAARWGGY